MSKTVNGSTSELLTAHALALVSEFALMLYRHEGKLMNVDSEDVLMQVYEHASEAKHTRLLSIFMQLEHELACQADNIDVPYSELVLLKKMREVATRHMMNL